MEDDDDDDDDDDYISKVSGKVRSHTVLNLVSMEGLKGSGTCWHSSPSTPHSAGRAPSWQQSDIHTGCL